MESAHVFDRSWFVALTIIAVLTSACGRSADEASGGADSAPGVAAAPGQVAAGPAATGVSVAPDGVPIAWESFGDGPLSIVLIHGWVCDRSYWDHQVEPLSERYRVVTLDLAGHGESGTDRDAWTITSYGGDVAAVVEALDLARVVLVGHSMGGDVAVDAARRLGDRVAGMVWIDTYSQLGAVRTPQQVQDIVGMFRPGFADSAYAFVRQNLFLPTSDPALAEWVSRDMASAPPDIALGSLESSFSNDRVVPVVLAELDLPVVSINPAEPGLDVASLERHGVEVVVVSDAGHFVHMESPDAFNPILIDAIERVES